MNIYTKEEYTNQKMQELFGGQKLLRENIPMTIVRVAWELMDDEFHIRVLQKQDVVIVERPWTEEDRQFGNLDDFNVEDESFNNWWARINRGFGGAE